MTFVKRQLSVSFQLQSGAGSSASTQFAESGSNTVSLSNLRMSAKIIKSGDPTLNKLDLTIYGMTLSLMNQLSTFGQQINLIRPSLVTVTAGDALSTVFQGNVQHAWSDFQGAPDVPFHVEAFSGLMGGIQPMPPTSFQGSQDAAQIMQQCASKMNLSFENNGVGNKLSDPYFWGSPRSQAQQCAESGNFNWAIDDSTLAIWPKNKARSGGAVTISPQNGMISYPSFTAAGILVRTLFNPQIKFGAQVQVQSSLGRANGTWNIIGLSHELESQLPKGQWFSTLECWNPSQQGNPTAPVSQIQ